MVAASGRRTSLTVGHVLSSLCLSPSQIPAPLPAKSPCRCDPHNSPSCSFPRRFGQHNVILVRHKDSTFLPHQPIERRRNHQELDEEDTNDYQFIFYS